MAPKKHGKPMFQVRFTSKLVSELVRPIRNNLVFVALATLVAHGVIIALAILVIFNFMVRRVTWVTVFQLLDPWVLTGTVAGKISLVCTVIEVASAPIAEVCTTLTLHVVTPLRSLDHPAASGVGALLPALLLAEVHVLLAHDLQVLVGGRVLVLSFAH